MLSIFQNLELVQWIQKKKERLVSTKKINYFINYLPHIPTSDTFDLVGRKRLNLALDLEEYKDNEFVKKTIFIFGISTLLFFPWAAMTPITQVVEASGEVIPKNSVTVLQHLEGGIISKVNVKNGQSVKKGDVLVKLMPNLLDSEYLATQARLNALTLQQSRIKAAIDGKEIMEYSMPNANTNYNSKVAQAQQELLDVRRVNREDQIETAIAIIQEKEAEILGLNKQLYEFTKQRDMWAQLVGEGASSRLQLSSAQAKVEEATGVRNEAVKALSQAEARLKALKSGIELEQSSQLAALINEESIISENIKKIKFQLERTHVISPIDGKISDLRYLNEGAVITPGSVVTSIVPMGAEKIADVRIPAKDISSVNIGQKVDVNFVPYDSIIYGSIPGKVLRISGDSIQNPVDKQYYFQAQVSLDRQYINNKGKSYPIQVGMPVVADIKGLHTNLLNYLFKPFLRTMKGSFRE